MFAGNKKDQKKTYWSIFLGALMCDSIKRMFVQVARFLMLEQRRQTPSKDLINPFMTPHYGNLPSFLNVPKVLDIPNSTNVTPQAETLNKNEATRFQSGAQKLRDPNGNPLHSKPVNDRRGMKIKTSKPLAAFPHLGNFLFDFLLGKVERNQLQ